VNKKEMIEYYIPVIEIPFFDYKKNEDNVAEFIDSEAERIKAKGYEVILVEYICNGKHTILLSRKKNSEETFKISSRFSSVKEQYGCIIEILQLKTAKVIKEY